MPKCTEATSNRMLVSCITYTLLHAIPTGVKSAKRDLKICITGMHACMLLE